MSHKKIEGHIEYLLEHGRSNVPLASLKGSDRINLLLDVLLGQTSTKSGRPRDYPFSETNKTSLELTDYFNSTYKIIYIGREKHKIEVSLFDILSSIRFIWQAKLSSINSNLLKESLLIAILQEMRITPLAHWAECFGLMRSNLERAFRKAKSEPVRSIMYDARFLAGVANLEKDQYTGSPGKHLIDTLQVHPQTINRLMAHNYATFRLKPVKVQRLLDRCRSTALQRGASAFASLASTKLRDQFIDKLGYFIHTDCDAVSILVGSHPYELSEIRSIAEEFLENEGIIMEWLPRLSEYSSQAKEENLSLSAPIPDFALSTALEISALELAYPPQQIQTSDTVLEYQTARVSNGIMTNLECSGVTGELSYISDHHQVPDWYSQSPDLSFGWAATTYSLAGRASRVSMRQSLRRLVSSALGREVHLPETQLEVLKAHGCDRLSYVKIDGDKVGELFGSVAFLKQPAFSQHLMKNLFDRWMNASVSLMNDSGSDLIPIEPIYMGGDDLLFSMPSIMVETFLRKFFKNTALAGPTEKLTFSFVAIGFEIKRSDFSDRPSTRSLQMLQPLLRLIKDSGTGSKLERRGIEKILNANSISLPATYGAQSIGPHQGLILSI